MVVFALLKLPVPPLLIQLKEEAFVAEPGIVTLSPWQIVCAIPALAVGFFWIVNTIWSLVFEQPAWVPVKVKVTEPAATSPGLKVYIGSSFWILSKPPEPVVVQVIVVVLVAVAWSWYVELLWQIVAFPATTILGEALMV